MWPSGGGGAARRLAALGPSARHIAKLGCTRLVGLLKSRPGLLSNPSDSGLTCGRVGG